MPQINCLLSARLNSFCVCVLVLCALICTQCYDNDLFPALVAACVYCAIHQKYAVKRRNHNQIRIGINRWSVRTIISPQFTKLSIALINQGLIV